MVKSTALLAFAAMASLASAEMLHYGSPVGATVWTAGQTGTVSWTNDCSDLPNTTFPITLNQQVGTQQVQVPGTGAIGTLDCSSSGSATVQVPATIPQGSTYSILVVNGGEQSYSALFTINSSIPAGGNTTVPSASVSASASAAPSSTATGTKVSLLPTVSGTPKPNPVSAGSALKAGSTAALVVVAAVGLML
ncbi:hypothetical protein KVV02_002078 [Mortierella alpina]|uniref:Yeast cell wall synthesis Kre9/Knh1-like N-terminal domain-containing protein n=1 Tax=Mortierella alpina TaxID=64518 RepID=A0A9P8CZ81_MORAP|nr:hypothetical protein KVV02_002078 [Mortierella alpina]